VNGRQILDGTLITNEMVHWLKKHKRAGVLLKLDFQKAYDTIDWDSLEVVLAEMGFSQRWRIWIGACIKTATVSIIFNGAPCKPFKMGRGLRQGDPLSAFLFVLMVEVLNRMLIRGEDLGLFKGLAMHRQAVTVSHLQFADDTLIFYEADDSYVGNIKWILLSFQSFSRLAVNYSKLRLIVIGKDDTWARNVATKLDCTLVSLPITYLGVPLSASMKRVASW